MFSVYVLKNSTGMFYVGHTQNIARRLSEHNNPKNGRFTGSRGPWILVYSEELTFKGAAAKRELSLKTGKGRAWLQQKLDDECA